MLRWLYFFIVASNFHSYFLMFVLSHYILSLLLLLLLFFDTYFIRLLCCLPFFSPFQKIVPSVFFYFNNFRLSHFGWQTHLFPHSHCSRIILINSQINGLQYYTCYVTKLALVTSAESTSLVWYVFYFVEK